MPQGIHTTMQHPHYQQPSIRLTLVENDVLVGLDAVIAGPVGPSSPCDKTQPEVGNRATEHAKVGIGLQNRKPTGALVPGVLKVSLGVPG